MAASTTTSLTGVGQLLDRSLRLFFQKPLQLLFYNLVPVIFSLVFALGFASTLMVAASRDSVMIWFFLLILPLIVGVIVIQIWLSAAQMFYIQALGNDKLISVKTSLSLGWKKAGSLFWTSLLAGLIIYAGAFLLVIPGIILAVIIFAAPFILIEENLSGLKAIAKSKAYVSGRGLAVFGRFALLYLLFFATYVLQAIPIIGIIVSLVVNLCFGPIFLIYTYLIYQDLKRTRPNPEFDPKASRAGWALLAVLGIILPILFFIFMAVIFAAIGFATLRNSNRLPSRTTPSYLYTTPTPTYEVYEEDDTLYVPTPTSMPLRPYTTPPEFQPDPGYDL